MRIFILIELATVMVIISRLKLMLDKLRIHVAAKVTIILL